MKKLLCVLLSMLFLLVGCSQQPIDNPIISFSDVYLGSEEKLTIYYFWGDGCPICAQQAPFLNMLESSYDVEILRFEVYNNKFNQDLFRFVGSKFGIVPTGVPTTFIADKHFVGFSPRIERLIIELVEDCLTNECEEILK